MNPHLSDDYLSVSLSSGQFVCVSMTVCIFIILLLYKESRGLAWKKNGFHSIPAAKEAGTVPVTVFTGAGWKLGTAYFTYVDVTKAKEFLKFRYGPWLTLNRWEQQWGCADSGSV